jgi:hypothetical protein
VRWLGGDEWSLRGSGAVEWGTGTRGHGVVDRLERVDSFVDA